MKYFSDSEKKIIAIAKKIYIDVMGQEKWNSLTDKEKHTAIMLVLRDIASRI